MKSTMKKFRKKPVVIEAILIEEKSVNKIRSLKDVMWDPENKQAIIYTLEGKMRGDMGDWLIKGVNGEIYPCKPDIFKKTYEPVNE